MKRLLIRGAIVAAPFLIFAAFAFPRLGSWLIVEDPLEQADAIFVLGGSRFERPLEAVDLVKEGWAPRIMLFRQYKDAGERELLRRGFPFPLESDVQAEALNRMGLPPGTVMLLDEQDSTRDEATGIRDVAVRNRWSRVIVVTSKQHTRRARLVITRRLDGTGVRLVMRATRYDRADTDRWWTERATLRFTLFETQRLFGYWIGVAD